MTEITQTERNAVYLKNNEKRGIVGVKVQIPEHNREELYSLAAKWREAHKAKLCKTIRGRK